MPSVAFALTNPVYTCVVTGCSGEICTEEKIDSICLWQTHYACFKKHGVCKENSDGKCGWVQTKALKKCMDNHMDIKD